MHSPSVLFGVGLALAALPGPATAAPPVFGGQRVPHVAGRAEACPALFGDQQVRSDNSARRARTLDWVDEEEDGVTVAHTNGRWKEPIRLRVRGVQLVSVRSNRAVVQISPTLAAAAGCQPGDYQVRVDDALTANTRVLAVLSHSVLVEHRGRLGFIAPRGTDSPRWLLAWRMNGEVRPTPAHLLYRSPIY